MRSALKLIMLKTAIIVQARLGSTRLPGKVLKPLGNGTVLSEVLRRCAAVPGVDVVVCAIPENAEDDPLVPAVESAGATVVRGSSDDVLGRYARAADTVGADIVMRVTSDCPLIDPGLCGALLAVRAAAGTDYAANNLTVSFPHGLDCEAFTADALHRAAKSATAAYDREHVTPWLRRDPSISRASVSVNEEGLLDRRWTLDFEEDYSFFTALFAQLPKAPAIPDWREVLNCLDAHPEIARINAARHVSRN